MDPNSDHQLWSRWTSIITVTFHPVHASEAFKNEMQFSCARFYRKLFGFTSEMKITEHFQTSVLGLRRGTSQFVVECRTEGAAAPDPAYRRLRMDEIAKFFGKNLRRYGNVEVRVDVFVEAGDVGDGKPRAQLILGPDVALMPRTRMLGQ